LDGLSAARVKGKETCRMVLSGLFLENRWEDRSDTG
jgi:hypothetical protein